MSKTHLVLFAIIAITSLMMVSVQYSDAAKNSKVVVDIIDERIWDNTETGASKICEEKSVSTKKTGYLTITLYADGHLSLEEESVKDHYDAEGNLIGSLQTSIRGDITIDEDGKQKAHGKFKVNCFNGEKGLTGNTVFIIHKNGKITQN
ncbi:hypothetical protein [Candidatus Nitrosopumilus sediminis]|uniref:Uncharacterized protein n=1 Tax=Candidatus Nitrosopumilus sediminis TaxID=1229909 RepID=K0BEI1_9ARCH|nr:hypothetical protein [Candidatus Nitrosopumilus sediminis]AFS82761.1 hypothetical protein NSED_04785 [Candidatus Nitrosopumilus sediminis]